MKSWSQIYQQSTEEEANLGRIEDCEEEEGRQEQIKRV